MPRHVPERIFDNIRRIHAHPQLQKQHPRALMPPQEVLVTPCRLIPALVLHKGVVRPEIHGHGPAAVGAVRNPCGRDLHIPLLLNHLTYHGLIVVGPLMARPGALPQAVVALGVKQPLLIKAGHLELVVHIGGKDEIVFVLHQLQKLVIHRPGGLFITIYHDMAAPPGPVFLQGPEGIKAAGIHIPDAVFVSKVLEMPLKAFPGVGQTRRGGQSRARADHHSIGSVKSQLQPLDFLRAGFGRFVRQYP